MSRKSASDSFTPSVLVFILGIIIICVGVYFEIYALTSSGVTMGRYGRPYGTGTIDGKGMIFCGIVIGGFGLILRNKKDNSEK